MKEKTNSCSCYNCSYYNPYYAKGFNKFERLDIGECTKTHTTSEKHNTCEKFSYKYVCRINRKQAALTAITENVHLLADLKQILEEDDEEALDELVENYKNRKRKGI